MIELIDIPDERSHHYIGRVIGESTRDGVLASIEMYFSGDKITTEDTRFQKLYRTARAEFPDFVKELEGIAEGASLSSNDRGRLMIFCIGEEELTPSDHCTSFAVRGRCGRILHCHKEKWTHPMPIYVVKAKPQGKPGFIGWGYAGQYPVAGMNENGIAYAGDSVDTEVDFNGLPKTCYLRSILEAGSIEDAVKRRGENMWSMGNNSLIVSQGEGRMVNFEWAPRCFATIDGVNYLVHGNYFLAPEMERYGTELPSDAQIRCMNIAANSAQGLCGCGVSEAQTAMMKYSAAEDKICSASHTIGIAIADPSERKLYFSKGGAEDGFTEFSL